ncbi:di-trans,poly-cis-decaprenylcistransferase [bacterium DOLJORAL78_65_58]|nr:MAG: di-trans,poly-cis-decaprenylcistransferase [bacterium DOLZORAL124_64_63]PIE75968.1 MAG: di-trans,poly-cis-decaprenylcistransferase [bacterium DOLJORAL78_65_58]
MSADLDPSRLSRLSTAELLGTLQGYDNLPRHVAIIMDGNGRWAKRRFLPRVAGHRAGRHSVRRCVRACGELGVNVLTLYTFSQENFHRPEAEVKALWHFLQETLAAEAEDLRRQNVVLRASGALEKLPPQARDGLQKVIDGLADNTGLILNLALAYGGRQEILQAAVKLSRRLAAGELREEDVTEELFAAGLYSPDLPDPDLVIRTSGEGRLSNFLLWQSAYSEILITPVLWPDFCERDLYLAVADYLSRERRFGKIKPQDAERPSEDRAGLLDPARWKRMLKGRP